MPSLKFQNKAALIYQIIKIATEKNYFTCEKCFPTQIIEIAK